MFITQDLKNHICGQLVKMELRVAWLEGMATRTDAWQEDLTFILAAERALHTSVEYTTDIGNLLIDALVMRDPGSYADILRILVEENVLSDNWFQSFVGILPLRARFIRDHAEIHPEEVKAAVLQYAGQFRPFISAIRQYINLG